MWLSLVERCVRDAEAAGSNPVIPTTSEQALYCLLLFFYEKSEFAHAAVPPYLQKVTLVCKTHLAHCRPFVRMLSASELLIFRLLSQLFPIFAVTVGNCAVNNNISVIIRQIVFGKYSFPALAGDCRYFKIHYQCVSVQENTAVFIV